MVKKFSSREKVIFAICLLVSAVYVVKTVIIDAVETRQEEMDFLADSLESQLKKDKKFVRDSVALEKEYEFYYERFKQVKSVQETSSEILSDIEKVSKRFNLNIAELKSNPVENDKFINKFSVNLTVNGSFRYVLEFIHTLQSRKYMFDVNEAYFEKGLRRDDTQIKARIVLSKIFVR